MDTRSRAPRRTSDVKVIPGDRPDWISGTRRPPGMGETVYTHEGTGVVQRVAGRTTGAGRMLEITMDDGRKHPFFTTDANILVKVKAAAVASGTA